MSKSLKGTELYGQTGSAEEAMRIGAVRIKSDEEHYKEMYYEAARRVVFKNCMESCGFPQDWIPNFNSNFYYNQLEEQEDLQKCFNTKMNLHFGESTARKENLYMDFAKMKLEFQKYENWNPNKKVYSKYEKGLEEEKLESMTAMLLEKTKKTTKAYQ